MRINFSDRHILHYPGNWQVFGAAVRSEETPERAEIIRRAVEMAHLGPIDPPSDHGLTPILAVHTPDFVNFLSKAYAGHAAQWQGAPPADALEPEHFANRTPRHASLDWSGQAGYYGFGTGSPIGPGTWEAAYWSAQCAISAADALLSGERCAYAICRPPGHHAAADLYGGFCYLNNAAIAASYIQNLRRHPNELHDPRIAILDIDYHHGNGTQEIFYTDPTILYVSLHASPDDDYPYFWGGADETGSGTGEGYNRNYPLPQGADDRVYLASLGQALQDIRRFEPECLVLSLGLDIVAGDSVGGFKISKAGLQTIGQRIAGLDLPTLIVQEGGYLLESLGEHAVAFLSTFNGTGPKVV